MNITKNSQIVGRRTLVQTFFAAFCITIIAALGITLSGCFTMGTKNSNSNGGGTTYPHADTDFLPSLNQPLDREPTSKTVVGGQTIPYNDPNPAGRPTSTVHFTDVYKSTDHVNLRFSYYSGSASPAPHVTSVVLDDSALGMHTYTQMDTAYNFHFDTSYAGYDMVVLTIPSANIFGARTIAIRTINFGNGWWRDNVEIKTISGVAFAGAGATTTISYGGQINFLNNFGSVTSPFAFDTVGTPIDINLYTAQSRYGYTFAGWFREGENAPYTGTQIPAAVVDVYARYTAKSNISVTFNYGEFAGKSVTFDGTYGELPTATRYGYNFVGWRTSPSGSLYDCIDQYTPVANENAHTLYAVWSPKVVRVNIYDLFFPTQDGTANGYIAIPFGADYITYLSNSLINEYKVGWNSGLTTWKNYNPQTQAETNLGVAVGTIDEHNVLLIRSSYFGGGHGTVDNPFKIFDQSIDGVANLATMRTEIARASGQYAGMHFALQGNVTLPNGEWTPIGSDNAPLCANFNGNGHTISNLTLRSVTIANNFCGLFGVVGTGGVVRNLTVLANNYAGDNEFGISGTPTAIYGAVLVAANSGTIENCTVNITQSSLNIRCSQSNGVEITAYNALLCAFNESAGVISNCTVSGFVVLNVTLSDSADSYITTDAGGLCARNDGTITRCTVTNGSVVSTISKGAGSGRMRSIALVGGLCGSSSGTVSHCKVTANVLGSNYSTYTDNTQSIRAGGLLGTFGGSATGSTAANCIFIGNVAVSMTGNIYGIAGGLVGNCEGAISGCVSFAVDVTANASGTNTLPRNCGYIVGELNTYAPNAAVTECYYDDGITTVTRMSNANTPDHTPTNSVGAVLPFGVNSAGSYEAMGFTTDIWDFAGLDVPNGVYMGLKQ
jgi:hypothetical protein